MAFFSFKSIPNVSELPHPKKQAVIRATLILLLEKRQEAFIRAQAFISIHMVIGITLASKVRLMVLLFVLLSFNSC